MHTNIFQPIAWQHLNACGHGQDDLLKFKLSIRIGKKCDLRGFERGMAVNGLF